MAIGATDYGVPELPLSEAIREREQVESRERLARIDARATAIFAAGTGKHNLPSRSDWDVSWDSVYACAAAGELARARFVGGGGGA